MLTCGCRSPAIEFCVGASLRSFIVDNNDDRKKLQGIIRRVYSQSFGPSVIEKKAEKSRYVLNDRVDTTRLNPKDALVRFVEMFVLVVLLGVSCEL